MMAGWRPPLLAAIWLVSAAASGAAAASGVDPLAWRLQRLSASWHSGALTWQEMAATAVMWVTAAALCLAAGSWVADALARRRLARDSMGWLGGGLLVAGWSFAVRFGLTEPNILTDGGSGYGRVMRYIEGYGGVAALVKLLPPEWDALMWRAMTVPRVLAALAPALLVWVGRGLGLSLSTSVLAGVMLASVPVHAALTASDLLVGSMASVQLAGVALVLASGRNERPETFAAGVLVGAWSMWFRPEGALGLLPLAAASLALPGRMWRGWPVRAALAALVLLVAVRALALLTSPTAGSSGGFGSLGVVAWGTVLTSTVLAPLWLWLPAPFAVLYGRPLQLLVMSAGLLAAAVPVYLRGLFPDPANTHLEALRYGLPAFAWLALSSATALDGTVRRVLGGRGGSSRRRPLLASVVLLLLVSAPVWMHREYLGRRYGHASSEVAIRHLLAKVPEGCVVAVPDDRAEGVDIEIHHRYANIAAEAFAQGQARAVEVVPASDLLQRATSDRGCALFLRGPYCYHAHAGRTAEVCRRIEERFVLDPIDAVSIEFRHHRLVTGPDVRRAPWYMEDMPIVLYRIAVATRPRSPE